jgi:hypothetical protein
MLGGSGEGGWEAWKAPHTLSFQSCELILSSFLPGIGLMPVHLVQLPSCLKGLLLVLLQPLSCEMRHVLLLLLALL